MPQISTIPAAALASYSIIPRYYLTFALSVFCVAVVALLVRSRIGLGIQAVREDEASAEASGVGAFGHKLLALAISTASVCLTGGAVAYYHVSYYPQHSFSPTWTFDAVLIASMRDVGTPHRPC